MKRVKQRFWVVTGDIGECLLCGERPTSVGFFVPEFPAEFHLQLGQALAYLLCDPCWEEGREDYIEAAIRGDIDQSRLSAGEYKGGVP